MSKASQQAILKKLYEVHNQGYDLTRKALAKLDANIYIAAEEAFDGKWLDAKRAFYKYEKEMKQLEKEKARKEAAAKKKKTAKTKDIVKTINNDEVKSNEDTSKNIINFAPVVTSEVQEELSMEPDLDTEMNISTESNNIVNMSTVNNDNKNYTELQLAAFQKIDTLLSDEEQNSFDVGVVPEGFIEDLKSKDRLFYAMAINIFGNENELINEYTNYYIKTNVNVSDEGMIDAISEGILNGDIVVVDSFKDKFGTVYDAMINKYGSLEDALVALLKAN